LTEGEAMAALYSSIVHPFAVSPLAVCMQGRGAPAKPWLWLARRQWSVERNGRPAPTHGTGSNEQAWFDLTCGQGCQTCIQIKHACRDLEAAFRCKWHASTAYHHWLGTSNEWRPGGGAAEPLPAPFPRQHVCSARKQGDAAGVWAVCAGEGRERATCGAQSSGTGLAGRQQRMRQAPSSRGKMQQGRLARLPASHQLQRTWAGAITAQCCRRKGCRVVGK